jgi:phenylacetate-CoA ligase
MGDIRAEWFEALERHRGPDWTQPESERYWTVRLDTASPDELAGMQSDKLRVAVRYAYACIPFYRRKFDAIGLTPGDITSVEDLHKIPLTTKQEMADDIATSPPWGTYTAVDDSIWAQRGWQIFASSGTTARPRVFRYTSLDRSLWTWANARAMGHGLSPGRDSASRLWPWPARGCGAHYALNLMNIPIVTAVARLRARARFVHEYRPTILACTPSYALPGKRDVRSGSDPAASAACHLFCAGESPAFPPPGAV